MNLPWHWRLRAYLGFDSARRGILYIPGEIQPRRVTQGDKVMEYLIYVMQHNVVPPLRPRLTSRVRIQLWLGFDRVRPLRRRPSVMPIILRGP